jgi:replication initiation and membrane attachment protein DnaB
MQMIRKIFSPKFKLFELDVKYFPESTQSLIPIEWVLRHGVLPLGMKQNKLNVGFLDPYSTTDFAAIQELLKKKKIQRFEIKAEQMLVVLNSKYGITLDAMQSIASVDLHPRIQKILEDFAHPAALR